MKRVIKSLNRHRVLTGFFLLLAFCAIVPSLVDSSYALHKVLNMKPTKVTAESTFRAVFEATSSGNTTWNATVNIEYTLVGKNVVHLKIPVFKLNTTLDANNTVSAITCCEDDLPSAIYVDDAETSSVTAVILDGGNSAGDCIHGVVTIGNGITISKLNDADFTLGSDGIGLGCTTGHYIQLTYVKP